MAFQKAQRTKVPLKIAVTGPTGSGKTYSSLLLAKGLADGGTIALLDTENESASLYDDVTDFDVQNLYAPFTVQKFADGIKEAEAGGYTVLVIDSLSHAWAANGGILSQKEAMDARGGNTYTNWGAATKQYENLKRVILESPLHIICCMRTKMDYEQKKNDAGKTVVEKIGLAPVMRDGMEYEFTVLLDVDADHSAWASKDRTGVFKGMVEPISEKHGKLLVQWQSKSPQDTRAKAQDAQGGAESEEPVTTPMLKWLGRVAAYLEKDWKAPESLTAANAKILYDAWNPEYLEAKKKAEEEAAQQAKEKEEMEASAAEAKEMEQQEAADAEDAQEEKKKVKK